MAEWLKAHAWKACVRETVPWVRIPLSPPLNIDFVGVLLLLWTKPIMEPINGRADGSPLRVIAVGG